MKRTCCYCQNIIDDGEAIPPGYDNEAAKSSCICVSCVPEAHAKLEKAIAKLKGEAIAKELRDGK